MKLPNMQKEIGHLTLTQKILISFISVVIIFGLITLIIGSNAVSKFGYDSFTMLRYGLIDKPIETLMNWQKDLSELKIAKAENDQLKNIISSQPMYKSLVDEQERKIKELESLMDFSSEATFSKEYAKVVYRDVSTWSNQITLNKGSNDGIKKDMAVISDKGLIGKVSQVNGNTCIVKLLTSERNDVNAAIKIELENGTTDGILNSYDVNKGTYQVQIFDANADIKRNMKVITSGSGGVFPSGIIVGKVKEIEELYNAKGKMVVVEPSVDFNDFEYVAILKVNN